MPPAHRKPSRTAERRRQRRQRRAEAGPRTAERETRAVKMAPLSMDPRRRAPVVPAVSAVRIDEETEYRLVRRDLWRLTVYSLICFALMIGVLLWLS